MMQFDVIESCSRCAAMTGILLNVHLQDSQAYGLCQVCTREYVALDAVGAEQFRRDMWTRQIARPGVEVPVQFQVETCLNCGSGTNRIVMRDRFKGSGLPYELCLQCTQEYAALDPAGSFNFRNALMGKSLLKYGGVAGSA
jgi:hypothetical protein